MKGSIVIPVVIGGVQLVNGGSCKCDSDDQKIKSSENQKSKSEDGAVKKIKDSIEEFKRDIIVKIKKDFQKGGINLKDSDCSLRMLSQMIS